MSHNASNRCAKARFAVASRGFTLIELMTVLVVVAILAAVALPSYTRYIQKSRARSAAADLVALSANLENAFQKTLSYPVVAQTADTAATKNSFTGWAPSMDAYFVYTVVSTTTGYTVTATGSGNMNCTLTLQSPNTRSASGASCGFTTW